MTVENDFDNKRNRIISIVKRAAETNEFYKRIIGNRVIVSYDQFKKIDKLSKQILRSEEYMKSVYENKTGLKMEITSGSTGEPLECYKNSNEIIKLNMILWRQRKSIDEKVNPYNFLSLYGTEAKNKIGDIFNLDRDNVESCLHRILAQQPRWLYGSVSILESLAKVMKENGITNETIKYIELTGETLEDGTKQFIEEAFGAKVINHYGMRENWCIAYECSKGRLHVCENVFAECENNELIISNMILDTMPLIRYKTGDMGNISYGKCECGNCNPTIELLGGRQGQIISGKNVLGDIFFKRLFSRVIVDGFNGIQSYNVEQTSEEEFVFKLVYDKDVEDKLKKEIEKRIEELLKERLEDDKLKVCFRRYERLDLINGKRRGFVNRCVKW